MAIMLCNELVGQMHDTKLELLKHLKGAMDAQRILVTKSFTPNAQRLSELPDTLAQYTFDILTLHTEYTGEMKKINAMLPEARKMAEEVQRKCRSQYCEDLITIHAGILPSPNDHQVDVERKRTIASFEYLIDVPATVTVPSMEEMVAWFKTRVDQCLAGSPII